MPELVRLASFLIFLVLGERVRRCRSRESRRRAVHLLLGCVVALSLAAGVSQQDNWPFASHTIAVGRARADSRICLTELYGLDPARGEWRLDPYSWMPVYESILHNWLEQRLPQLPPARREQVLAFLLERAERSRARLAEGKPLGPERLLGRAGAPYWLLLPRRASVPQQPYVGLRAYEACWLPSERVERSTAVRRTMRFEYLAR